MRDQTAMMHDQTGKPDRPRWTVPFRLAGHAGVLLIILLSVVPGSSRPHTGAGGGIEHWTAYLLVGFCYGMGYPPLRQGFIAALGLASLAGALELVQIYVPGRNAEISGFASSAFGACAGLFAGYLLMRAFRIASP